MPGTLLSTGNTTVNKRVKVSALTKFVFEMQEGRKKVYLKIKVFFTLISGVEKI